MCLVVACGSEVKEATSAPESPVPPTPTPTSTPLPPATSTPEPDKEREVLFPDGETPVSMVLVPPGEFIMGASEDERDTVLEFGWSAEWAPRVTALVLSATPAHVVNLSSFYIDKYEVTNSQYQIYLAATGETRADFWDQPRFNRPDQPAVGLSWFGAKNFCEWAGKQLPTEAQWEKAARGPKGLSYPWGSTWDRERLHSAEGIAQRSLPNFGTWMGWRESLTDPDLFKPAAVGSFPEGASPYGAMDMAGNVWEWVADWYDEDYYAQAEKENPAGPAVGVDKVLRGGAFDVPSVIPYTWLRENFIPPGFLGSMVTWFRCSLLPF